MSKKYVLENKIISVYITSLMRCRLPNVGLQSSNEFGVILPFALHAFGLNTEIVSVARDS